MITKAMILAAGFGKRIQPLTIKTPKPLLKIGEETLLSNSLKFLESYGVKQVVINIHYLGDQIVDYINNSKFNLSINIVKEKDKILDTGGGVLNAIKYFSNEPFLIINPDTVWNSSYLKELKVMENSFFENKKNTCALLVVHKKKSFDKLFKGDFDLQNNLISRKEKNKLNYIYTGLQIIHPDVFSELDEGVFSINRIWDRLIQSEQLYGIESNINFFHVSTLDIYKTLSKKNLNIK